MNMRRIAFIGCHCDDLDLGCGGTIAKHRDLWDISCFVLCTQNGRFAQEQALSLLGVKKISFFDFADKKFDLDRQLVWEAVESIARRQFDVIFCNEADAHQDHQIVTSELMRSHHAGSILWYSPYHLADANFFVEITQSCADLKIQALSYYAPYLQAKSYFQKDFVLARLRMAGFYTKGELAESFRLERWSSEF